MGFMKPVAQYGDWYIVENHRGESFTIPGELFRNDGPSLDDVEMYIEGRAKSIDKKTGWCARLSADGYLDCTDWIGPFNTEEEAMKEIMQLHDVDENGDDIY